jgi:transposase
MGKAEKRARPPLHALESSSTTSESSTPSVSRAAGGPGDAPPVVFSATVIPGAIGGRAAMSIAPNPEVVERPVRRTFTADFKRRIVEEADACAESGAVGALLRRHGLYSSHLTAWRAQYRQGALRGLTPRQRGPKAEAKNPLAERVARLEREKARLEKRLQQAETIIDFQKKVSELLGIPLKRPDSDGND